MSKQSDTHEYQREINKYLKVGLIATGIMFLSNHFVLAQLPETLRDQATTYGMLAGMTGTIIYNFVMLVLAVRLPWPVSAKKRRNNIISLGVIGNTLIALGMAAMYYTNFLTLEDDATPWAEATASFRSPIELGLYQGIAMLIIGLTLYVVFTNVINVRVLINWAYPKETEPDETKSED